MAFDCHHAACPPINRFASHHAAAAAQVEPMASMQTRGELVHDGGAHHSCGRTGLGAAWALETSTAAQAELTFRPPLPIHTLTLKHSPGERLVAAS